MTLYWLLIGFPVIGHLVYRALSRPADLALWWTLGILWVVVIGFRIEVGCDWPGYLQLYQNFAHFDGFGDLLLRNDPWFTLFNWDPGYVFLNWASAKLGFGIYGVNTICGLLIVLGLSAFCRKLPAPWLAWLVATPYFLIVVSMGYSRQAVAIGLFCWALSFAITNRSALFVILTLIASLFHKSALFLLFIGFLPYPLRISRPLVIATTCLALAALPVAFFLFNSYLFSSPYHSDGAFIRSFMNALPALFLVPPISYIFFTGRHPAIIYWISFLSLISIFVVHFSTTLIDRAGLYLIPIQVYAWSVISTLPQLATGPLRIAFPLIVTTTYIGVAFIWLNYAEHRECWLPYDNLLFTYLFR